MATIEQIADAALDRMQRWTRGFPKPSQNQGVRADKLLTALRALEPMAKRISSLAEGTPKASFTGAGYLTGPKVTADDRAQANRILYEINTRLPTYGTNPVESWLLQQIKGAAQRLLMIATDLDVGDQWVTILDKASWAWDAVGQAIVELPETLGKVTGSVLREAGKAAGSAASGFFSGLGVGGTLILGAMGVGTAIILLRR